MTYAGYAWAVFCTTKIDGSFTSLTSELYDLQKFATCQQLKKSEYRHKVKIAKMHILDENLFFDPTTFGYGPESAWFPCIHSPTTTSFSRTCRWPFTGGA